MKKYDLYLFDFDGTLLNTMKALEHVFKVSYEHVGAHFDPKDTKLFACIPLDEGYRRLNADPEKWDDFCKYIEKSLDFPESLRDNEPYPETMEFIEYIRNNKIPSGIVTSNKDKHVKEVLDIFGIPLDTFNIYLSSKQCKNHKPHPEPLLRALNQLNYQGDLKKVVYVGDGINDTICANRAGVDAVLIDRNDEFPDSENYIKVHSLLELFN